MGLRWGAPTRARGTLPTRYGAPMHAAGAPDISVVVPTRNRCGLVSRLLSQLVLGLEPVEQRPGGLRYQCGSSSFAVFESAGSASGTHTQMSWEVDDIEATLAALRARGVVFEEYDAPGLKTMNGVADIKGNYPSKGIGERGAWFRDSEGNLLSVGQPVRR